MPYKKKKTKKVVRRRRRAANNGFLRTKGPGLLTSTPMGKTHRYVTRYADISGTLNPGAAGAPITHVYSMNGLYDPDITGTGHQPLGFDQLVGGMFDHYTVIGSRARVTFQNPNTAYSCTVMLQLKDSSTPTASLGDTILENGLTRWSVLSPRDAGGSVKTLSINCSPSKYFGTKVMAHDKYQGTSAANPDDQVYLHIHAIPNDSVDLSPLTFQIVIDYIAILTEPKQLNSS